jgi:hypothetical protein
MCLTNTWWTQKNNVLIVVDVLIVMRSSITDRSKLGWNEKSNLSIVFRMGWPDQFSMFSVDLHQLSLHTFWPSSTWRNGSELNWQFGSLLFRRKCTIFNRRLYAWTAYSSSIPISQTWTGSWETSRS